MLSRVAISHPLHWERLDALKFETTHSVCAPLPPPSPPPKFRYLIRYLIFYLTQELMSGHVEVMLRSSNIYQGKHTTVGICKVCGFFSRSARCSKSPVDTRAQYPSNTPVLSHFTLFSRLPLTLSLSHSHALLALFSHLIAHALLLSQIPIKNYLVLSSSERIVRFSEDVMANGSSIGGNVSTHEGSLP